MLLTTVECFLSCQPDTHLYIVDNSPSADLGVMFEDLPVSYHFYGKNVGYGRGHNWAFFSAEPSRYHLIINPDINFDSNTITELIRFMDSNMNVGIICPKILNEDGTIQYLNKRYPTIFNLFIRRFVPKRFHHFFQLQLDRYEMKEVGYDDVCDVEFLSGCFMLCRSEALKLVGGFDPSFFMYFEDSDLCRKMQQKGYRTVCYPHVEITHIWERASHKSLKMTWVFIESMIKYFNKWGWRFY